MIFNGRSMVGLTDAELAAARWKDMSVVMQSAMNALNPVKELQQEFGFAVIFVTHDMSLISHFSDRLMVMYAGQVAEFGPTRPLSGSPLHPYSAGLMEAFPSITGPRRPLRGDPGQPAGPGQAPQDCRSAPRCRRTLHAVDEVSLAVDEQQLHRPELSRQQRYEEALRVFDVVGLTPAAEVLQRHSHELSGGQRQRYFTHDLASARHVADRLIIMYAAQIAESGPVEEVLANPKHPYTQLLLPAAPDPRARLGVGAATGKGGPPKVIDPTPGCRFRWRCPLAIDERHHVTPPLRELLPGHSAACHVARADAVTEAFR